MRVNIQIMATSAVRSLLLLLLAAWGGSAVMLTAKSLAGEDWSRRLKTNPIDAQATAGTSLAQYLYVADRYVPASARLAIVNRDPYYVEAYIRYWGDYWLFPRQVSIKEDLSKALNDQASDYVIFIGPPTELEPFTNNRTLLVKSVEHGMTIATIEAKPSARAQ